MNNGTKILIAVGASLAVGAALGVLYAPEEGYETRKKLMKRSKRLMASVNDGIDEGKESLEDIKEVLQHQLQKVNKKLEGIKF